MTKYDRAAREEQRELKKVDKEIAKRLLWAHRHLSAKSGRFKHSDFADMFLEQAGLCAICGGINESGRRLSIDHDHKTGLVRGLLCNNCNALLGFAKDRPGILLAAVGYLMRAK